MDFKELVTQYSWDETMHSVYQKTAADVENALASSHPGIDDFMALISPAAEPYLEQMAQLSRKLTRQRFGNTIQFYVPLYLTNACTNHCIYCGFNHNNKIQRIVLTLQEISDEMKAIKKIGPFEHILLVTGESPRHAGVDYMEKAIRAAREHFSAVSLEVQPLETEEYSRLIDAGLNSVYVYQETYNKERYSVYHPAGKKRDYYYRVDTPDRLGKAGIRRIGMGVLIGLEDWRTDCVFMARHLTYLQKKYWRTKYSISFPRMRPHKGEGFKPNVVMTDRQLAQLIFAFCIFDNDVEMALSTRESASFRDNMLPLGVTNYSAGSKTEPGGYATYPQALEQFAVNDSRSPEEVVTAVKERGYEVVWKDWDDVLNQPV